MLPALSSRLVPAFAREAQPGCCCFVALLLLVYFPIASEASLLDKHLEAQTMEAKALRKGGCWRRTLTKIKQSCPSLDPSTQASLALQLLNCHLESMGLEDIRCGEPVTACAAFKEIAQSPNLLTVYAQFYVQVLTTCAFTELHFEQERLFHVAKRVSESIQRTAADGMELLRRAHEITARRARISELQRKTVASQSELRELVDSDHIYRLQHLVKDLKRFLQAASYTVRIALENICLFVVLMLGLLFQPFSAAKDSLILLCVLKFLFERQILVVATNHDLSPETVMPDILKVSRAVLALLSIRELYASYSARSQPEVDYDVLEEQLAEIRARLNIL